LEAKLVDVEKKKKARDLKKKQIQRNRLKKQLAYLLFVVFFVFGAYKIIFSSYFNLRQVEIYGNKKVPSKQIASLVNPLIGKNIFKISSKNLIKNLTKIAWIENVNIDKKLPDSLIIKIKEEKPAFILNSSNKFWRVSSNCKIIEPVTGTSTEILISSNISLGDIRIGKKVKDKAVINAFNALKSLDTNVVRRISGIVAKSLEDFSFFLDKGKIQVYYGKAEEAAKKNAVLKSVLNDIKKKRLNVYYIDVRTVLNPVIKNVPSVRDIQKSI
jgi:cell division protein FtsQ